MANTTVTQVPYPINNFYDKNLLARAIPLFIHTRWAQVRDLPRNNTNVIKFRRYTNLTAQTTPLTEGTTPGGSQLAVTDITATVAQYGDFVTLTDLLDFSGLDPILTETSDLLGTQAGDTLDQVTRDILVAGTTVQYANGKGGRLGIAATDVMNYTEAKKAIRTLKGNKARKVMSMVDASTGYNTVPLNAAFIGLVHPNTTYDLAADTNFIPVEKYASQSTVMEGEVGAFREIRFVESTNCKVFSGAGTAGADVYATMILAQDCYGVSRISGEALKNIIKPFGSAGVADPLDQRATSGWKATFTAVRLNETWMLRIEHGVSA